ncbi:hypothetical protein O2W14_04385 [Modestobacter sp. VKM Ac-2986]|uniref:hypothetical protein n=1 Tax=Modestobacter sp. VKM Ac-2986 TaxID=3004140 RepID=UPI0022AB3131|nr:hypothetical protein [Modestobacter sp. VKM Ac-2986]MCZ2828071.1 hypothetical protein [Modestobacter sp. VKM Ac-2986]
MRDSRGNERSPGRDLVETGELVAGSMTRAVAGLLFDPEGSAVRLDERLAGCLREAATTAADLPLTWERARAGAVLAFTAELSVTRSAQGRPVRTDGFFHVSTAARSAAERLVEDVVQAARATTEERRVRHLGYLVAEVVVSPDVDGALAARALQLAQSCSWRQLVFLAAVGRRDRTPLPVGSLEDSPRAWRAWGAREDLTDLQRAGLLDPAPVAVRPGAVQPRLRPADLRLTRRGVLVHRLLALDFVREDDVAAAVADLDLPTS